MSDSDTGPINDLEEGICTVVGAAVPVEPRPKKNGEDKEPPPLRIIDPQGFQGQPIPDRQWIVPDWVPCGAATALYGPGGTGKSLLAMQLMTAAALGKSWLGVPVSPVRSIALFCEDDEDELQRRQAAINRQLYNCDFADLGNMRWLPRLGEQNAVMTFENGIGKPTDLADQLQKEALAFGAKLVVVDTVADTFAGNQNDAGQVRQYVQFGLARLARAIGGAVLACAHPSRTGISSKTGESGSVQWDAGFRSRLYLSAPAEEPVDPNARILSRKKANYAARDETISLRWHDGVMSAAGSGNHPNRPGAEAVFLTLLDEMTVEEQTLSHNSRASNYAPKLFVMRPGQWGYRVSDFARAMQALFNMGEIKIEEYGKPSHRMQRIVRQQAPLF